MNRVILSLPISQFAIVIVCTTITKGSRLSKPRACGNFSASPTWSTRPMKRCKARSTSLSLQEHLLATDKRWKLVWFGHVTYHNSLSKTILQGTLEGWQCHGWQRKCWMDNTSEWTSLPMPEVLTRASCKKRLEEDLCWINPHISPPPLPQLTQVVKGLNWTSHNTYPVPDKRLEMLLLS